MISEIARAIFGPSVPESRRYVSIFTAYVDASRPQGSTDADVYTLAAFIADAAQWDAFTAKWKGVLDHYDLDEFHMTDFEACKDAFETWQPKDKRRPELIRALVKVIDGYTIGSVAYGVSQAMFDAVVSPTAAIITGGPYWFLFANLLWGRNISWARSLRFPPIGKWCGC